MTNISPSDDVNDFIQFHHNPIVAQKNEEIAHLQKLCEEQRVEIANLRQIIESLDVDDPKATDALLETMKMQKVQLATQTERIGDNSMSEGKLNAFDEWNAAKIDELESDIAKTIRQLLEEGKS